VGPTIFIFCFLFSLLLPSISSPGASCGLPAQGSPPPSARQPSFHRRRPTTIRPPSFHRRRPTTVRPPSPEYRWSSSTCSHSLRCLSFARSGCSLAPAAAAKAPRALRSTTRAQSGHPQEQIRLSVLRVHGRVIAGAPAGAHAAAARGSHPGHYRRGAAEQRCGKWN
jgi:hypothetical protein